MSSAGFVDDASRRASWLVQRESRGPGDTLNAMRRLAARYGVPYGTLWALRYRKPKDMLISAYAAIIEAHEAECGRQTKLLEHERARTAAKTWIGRALVASGEGVAGEDARAVDAGDAA